MKTVHIVKSAAKFIQLHTNQSYQESKIEAEEIFMHVLGINKPKIYSNISISITKNEHNQINYILDKRKKEIPLSYILKKHLFYQMLIKNLIFQLLLMFMKVINVKKLRMSLILFKYLLSCVDKLTY